MPGNPEEARDAYAQWAARQVALLESVRAEERGRTLNKVLEVLDEFNGTAQREDYPQDRLLEEIKEAIKDLANETATA